MKAFPALPFELDESDRLLIEYLKCPKTFAYFDKHASEAAGMFCADIPLNEQGKQLLQLWLAVLTSALRKLKECDPRESGRDASKREAMMESFFHRESLGIQELEEVLGAFAESEGLLYGAAPERYRDHLAHAVRVWLIGHGLICGALDHKVYVDKNFDRGISEAEIECMWAVVALCHDIGYPIAKIDGVNETARRSLKSLGMLPVGDLRFAFSQQMLPFQDSVVQLMSSKPVLAPERWSEEYFCHLQNKYYLKFLKSLDRLDHGVVSALLVSRASVYFLESDMTRDPFRTLDKEEARQFLIRREILRAIAAHTCPDVYHLRFDTLAFLLFLVDEIQWWGRPTLSDLKGSQSNPPGDIAPATVRKYAAGSVDVELRLPEIDWERPSGDQGPPRIVHRIQALHRVLRLAVDTQELARASLTLLLKGPNPGDEAKFVLADGKVSKEPAEWFQ